MDSEHSKLSTDLKSRDHCTYSISTKNLNYDFSLQHKSFFSSGQLRLTRSWNLKLRWSVNRSPIVEHAEKRRVRNILTAPRLFMAPHPGKNRQNLQVDSSKMWHQFSRIFLNPRLLVRSAGKSVLCGTKPWRSFLWILRA